MSKWSLHICVLTASVIATLGCSGFEDEFSGTYRQVLQFDEDGELLESDGPLYELEVFRYGHDIQAMLRTYDGKNLFLEEERCDMSEPAKFEDGESFETRLVSGVERLRLNVRMQGEERALLRINRSGSNRDLQLERIEEVPDARCDTIAPLNMRADFAGRTQENEFPEGTYKLRQPYFGVQWVAVEPQPREGGLTIWAQLNQQLVAAEIPATRRTENGLRGQLNFDVEPPDELTRTFSGSTRYSLAYFIVVDNDPQSDQGTFIWDRNSGNEPIVASAVRRGTRPDFEPEHDQFGTAVLFVEDSLLDLHPNLLQRLEGAEQVDPLAHYYVVRVYALDDTVVGVRFMDQSELAIPVVVTEDYLDQSGVPLPLLFP